jgi:SAM-dependent methyltransferase
MDAAHLHPDRPSDWVRRFAPLIAPGAEVLDLACGAGRHARYLAQRGMRVDAVDRDAGALASLAGVPGVSTLCADLEQGDWPCAGRRWDAIVVANYLHRPLFPVLAASLRPQGVLIYETFMQGNERFGRPARPEFLLAPGELLAAFGAVLSVVAFEQGEVMRPKPAVVQRLCAAKDGAAARLRLPGWPAPDG